MFLSWVKAGVARRAAFVAFASAFAAGAISWVLFEFLDTRELPDRLGLVWVLLVALVAGLFTFTYTRAAIIRRLELLRDFLEGQASQSDFLKRVPDLGHDEVGQAAEATNRVLASLTSLKADLMEQGRELAQTQEELRLQAALASKTRELEERLNERKLLFDVLRISASNTELDEVLKAIAANVAPQLRFREFAFFLRNHDGRFVIREAHGFKNPRAVLGRSVEPGEGVAGEVARAGEAVIVPDVAADSDYLSFWGEAPREGSFAAFPIKWKGELIGILGCTRPYEDPLSEPEARVLGAIADQCALAIRHAQLFDELRELSTHDELTGVANRRLLQGRLHREIERARRFGRPLGLLAVDIDHFKKLNDRLGHATGDAALKAVAGVLEHAVRKVDTVARVGGEEFVVLLPQTDLREAIQVAEKLRAAVEKQIMPGGESQPEGRLTISVGVAQLGSSEDAQRLLARADDAMYLAKQRGRNRVAVHEGTNADTNDPIHVVN